MHHPLLVTALETKATPGGLDSMLVLSSPLGTTYRVQLDSVTANTFRLVIANEHKLVAEMHMDHHKCDESCDQGDDDEPTPPRQPGNRISKN